jgi:hypothetical protein
MGKARESRPTSRFQPPVLRVDAEKYPNLRANPALERALRIRQEIEKGRPREEAVALADEAMGRMGKTAPPTGRPKAVGWPANGPRPGGARERPRKRGAPPPAMPAKPAKRRR